MTLLCSSEALGPEGSQRTPRGGESQVRLKAVIKVVVEVVVEAVITRGSCN